MKVVLEGATMILIAPKWSRREWYPTLLDLLIDIPIRLPIIQHLVTKDQGTFWHHNPADLALVAWKINGQPGLSQDFQERLPQLVSQLPQTALGDPMLQAGEVFLHGVNSRVLIDLQQLFMP